jgi:hypothetical protein
MKSPEDIHAALRTRWESQWRTWLGGAGDWPQRFSLSAPSEATARDNWEQFLNWISMWRRFNAGQVVESTRRWPSLGMHTVPTHVSFGSPYAIAAFLGGAESSCWESAAPRFEERLEAWPNCEAALRRIAPWLGSATVDDYRRLISVVDWLTANPHSGLWLRQLPVPGLHTKWVETNISALRPLLASRLGRDSSGSFEALAGLSFDTPRRRVRILDHELRAALGGLEDITVSIEALAEWALPVRAVVVVENLQTALAFGDLPGTVLLFGSGFSVSELARLGWLSRVPVLYWGDIDNAGYAILHSLRQAHPHTVSVLMDEETLLTHRALWSHDESRPGAALTLLTPDESTVYARLGAGVYGPAVRLEQERVDWSWAMERIALAIDSAPLQAR